MEGKWIWQETVQMNQYVEFLQDFTAEEGEGVIKLCAETEFAAYLNGKLVAFNQYDEFPETRSYNSDSVQLQKQNRLCVIGYHQGTTTFQNVDADPFLLFQVEQGGEVVAASGEKTKCRISPAYFKNAVMSTPQMGLCFDYDASKEDDWMKAEYQPGTDWNSAVVKESEIKMQPRPLPQLVIRDRRQVKVVAQGIFTDIHREEETIAYQCANHSLRHLESQSVFTNLGDCRPGMYVYSQPQITLPRPDPITLMKNTAGDGVYVVVDVGREECGFIDVELTAPKGKVIDIAWGEHLDDLRVRCHPGLRNFASRYITKEGNQQYFPVLKRIAGRYLQLFFHDVTEDIQIDYIGIRPCEYPFDYHYNIELSDQLHNKIAEVSRRTLTLCAHEHYEDCPWREQALYGFDSRNQMLFGYYALGEYAMPRASIDLLGQDYNEEGWFNICSPTRGSLTIPMFCFMWPIQMLEYLMHSGDYAFVKEQMPRLIEFIKFHMHNRQEEGLLAEPIGKMMWRFYDWTDGYGNSSGDETIVNRHDAPHQMTGLMALKSALKLMEYCGNNEITQELAEIIEQLGKAIHTCFWNPAKKLYASYYEKGEISHYGELVQSLAIVSGVARGERADLLRKVIAEEENGLVQVTLSTSIFKYQALLEDKQYGERVLKEIEEIWGGMLYQNATSFWETVCGADDFGGGASLCHAWSAVPSYIYFAYVLGVKPTKPGFETYSFDPMPCGLYAAKGNIRTAKGELKAGWIKAGEEIKKEIEEEEKI